MLKITKNILKRFIPNKIFLKLQYRYHFKKKLNFKNLTNYNEKIQWLKLNDRKPHYVTMVDKFAVRDYVADKVGEKYLVPLHGVFDKVSKIEWDGLPDQYVIKCTHGSGSNIIVEEKSKFNRKHSVKQLNHWLKKNWFWYGREWPYKKIRPRIIIEKYLGSPNSSINDYRVFCFNGVAKFITVDFNILDKTKKTTKRNLYDLSWNLLKDHKISYENELTRDIARPEKLGLMIKLSEKLSFGMKHLRVDFYCVDNNLYVGELTLYHMSGYGKIEPNEFNQLMGSWIEINN